MNDEKFIVIVFREPFNDGKSACEIGLCELDKDGNIDTKNPIHKIECLVDTCDDIKLGGDIYFQVPEALEELDVYIRGVHLSMPEHPDSNLTIITQGIKHMHQYYTIIAGGASVN